MNAADFLESRGLRCPCCKNNNIKYYKNDKAEYLHCGSCKSDYPVINESPLMLAEDISSSKIKGDIQEFWKGLYHAAYKGDGESIGRHEFEKQLEQLEKLFKTRKHLAVTEMPVKSLSGLKILEIGPGAGAHSSLFCKLGAEVTSLDITKERVYATQRKFKILESCDRCVALQGDAENLPFVSNHFDIVYSNGVLHHTPNTQKAIDEVFRILKKDGKAIIMLYARHSYLYWVNIFLLRGILLGNIFRKGNWLGRVTEWMSDDKQKIYNPETKVYSEKEILKLFLEFSDVKVRKSSFHFIHLPFIGKWISILLSSYTGVNKAGTLVYDQPWRNETKLELLLGRFIGFNLNISAAKRKDS